ncbi:MAG: hypothetical protein RL199_73, partial [Pseudomonadota bacterium]
MPHSPELADVVLLGGVPGRYTYLVPPALSASALPGRRVVVPFSKRLRAGVVVARRTLETPPPRALASLDRCLDDGPLVSRTMLELSRWASAYYACEPSHALKAALPPGALGTELRRWVLTPAGRQALYENRHAPRIRQAMAAIEGNDAATDAAPLPEPLARELAAEGLARDASTFEAGAEEPKVEVATLLESPEARTTFPKAHRLLAEVYTLLKEQPRQLVEALRAKVPDARSALSRLGKRGLVRIDRIPRPREPARPFEEWPRLTDDQSRAVDALETALDEGRHQTFLLEGVTGSGKTEVYLRTIAHARRTGAGAIVAVPEIALTPQLSRRFAERFGNDVAVLHSGLSDNERTSEWHRIRRGEACIVVGARSALFAPVERLRVVVVDEEHDPSFKQASGLRYQGRDLAVVLGRLSGALVVLGSATPSFETLHNVEKGRYRHLALPTRVDPRPMPEVTLVDLRGRAKERAAGGVAPSGLVSPELAAALEETVGKGEQAIVFLNRRGHSTSLLCRDCGTVRQCPRCEVSYTWHDRAASLVCHYCGDREPMPAACGHCSSTRLVLLGAGTEKLEEELARAVPTARIDRLDRDTATTTRQLEGILGRFARRETDLLVGTQMVSKGHDFPGVTLVAVLMADSGLHQPDFRAGERTAQLLTQVAGRAGRGDRPGRVLVQTFTPEAPAIAAVVGHDYASFARAELQERKAVGYPPYRRLALVRLEGI